MHSTVGIYFVMQNIYKVSLFMQLFLVAIVSSTLE